jgi:hypothetical protein
MHVMLKRAAASAIPALLGLAVFFPATAMAAPHGGPVHGGLAHGIIIYGKDEVAGNHVYANGAAAINNSVGTTAGNGVVGTAGNSHKGHAVAHGRH